MFKLEEIQPGYVVELNHETLCMVTYNSFNELCLSGPDTWSDLNLFNDKLESYSNKITKIYGRASTWFAYELTTNSRQLLWERDDV